MLQAYIMVKPLSFKGEKKSRKRKAPDPESIKAEPSSALIAHNATEAAEDDSWVTAEAPTDIVGPIIFALPSQPPTCIACDANGKVFASELENIVVGDPRTAEPHEIRQVWVASRVAGTESISFKGHHGRYDCLSLLSIPPCLFQLCGSFENNRYESFLLTFHSLCSSYLSCDKYGVLYATHEAISPEESFLCIPAPDSAGLLSIQTEREKFLSISEPKPGVVEIRGDAESISFLTTFRIRMQARFKPKLKANKESKAREKISRKELEEAVGRKLEDDEVRRLKKARVEGDYHEAILDVRVKGKHDKYS